ncbi:MAG: hypothetical protein GZ088_15945 [Acidipila sp.]|nr:hypothetical protein [Acidipila sp.]
MITVKGELKFHDNGEVWFCWEKQSIPILGRSDTPVEAFDKITQHYRDCVSAAHPRPGGKPVPQPERKYYTCAECLLEFTDKNELVSDNRGTLCKACHKKRAARWRP